MIKANKATTLPWKTKSRVDTTQLKPNYSLFFLILAKSELSTNAFMDRLPFLKCLVSKQNCLN